MGKKVRVAILDDHPSIIDGYRYRLGMTPEIDIVATANSWEEMEQELAGQPVDVLMLDINAPTSPANNNPYPVLHAIPQLLQTYPRLSVLVISMHNERLLIRGVMEAGASGYLLKDDQNSIDNLGQIVQLVAHGDIYYSQRAHQLLRRTALLGDPNLTPRQLEVLSMCAAYPNDSTAELAERLGVANSTVRNLLSSAYLRLDVNSRTAAVAQARQAGLITPAPVNPVTGRPLSG